MIAPDCSQGRHDLTPLYGFDAWLCLCCHKLITRQEAVEKGIELPPKIPPKRATAAGK